MEPAFDTLRATKRLRDSGMPSGQAEATVRMASDMASTLVTRKHLKNELNRHFNKVDKRLNAMDGRFNEVDRRLNAMDSRFDAMEASMKKQFATQTVRLVAILSTIMGMMFAAMRYFS